VTTGAGATTFTPLSQTNFFPDFIQVNFMPLLVAVVPALAQVAPALGAAALATPLNIPSRRIGDKTTAMVFFMR
jgi:hypothetical protein